MVAFSIEQYHEHTIIKHIDSTSKTSQWLFDRLMAFPGTKYNKFERSWVISRCYQHLVEIVLVTHLNNISKKEWLAEYKASIGVKELGSAEARSLLKEQFETLSSRDWEDYLLLTLPEESSWRRILEKKFRLENGIY